MRLLVNLMPEHDAFHIYVYTKSYFYRNLATGRLQYLTVKHSQYVKAHLSLQVSNLSRFCSSFICYCCSNMCFTHHSQVTKAIFSNLRTSPSLTFTSTHYTVPESTPDCENDPAYDRDQVVFACKIFLDTVSIYS